MPRRIKCSFEPKKKTTITKTTLTAKAKLIFCPALNLHSCLPDGYSQIFRLYVFGPSGFLDYGSATLCCKI